ncbi:arabinogalactan oligomer/maltooligosaccharide transport system substrate-binding protein [Symbiobacterium terraclitae]|uniref:Maltodextrin-binding protein n=1 Tax=Symbiobacterium terraclitae TaxID=557451 RepID=A0ABS4JVW3_9FIRM|nr:maltose ABC transporter substrate-binding protein [Symbiobacterium terraclitae]MBP2018559.1 arabinogalactan oligomer/maltooligosaccharide transport system substrate-binding protein [Symbiobacterium terraclitae]
MRTKKWLAGALSVLMLSLALAGCGSAKSPTSEPQNQGGTQQGSSTNTPAKTPVELTVWSHLTSPEVQEVQKVADEWAAKTGNKVTVLEDQTGFQEYAAAATAGQGPDIMYGLPHDNLGPFWKAGLLEPVPDGVIDESNYEKVTLDAVSYEGKKFAVPISYEAVALFYNKALVSEPPTEWDEFLALAQEKGFMYKIKDFYFTYGFIAGNGGYVFKDKGNGNLDPTDVGFASEGGIAGLQLLSDFVNKYKLMPSDVDDNMAKAEFQAGNVAFYLSGSWDVKGFEDAGVDFGIAPMPKMPNGQPFSPFVGVQAAFVNADSKHKAEAWDLIKYLQENVPERLLAVGNRIPAQKSMASALQTNPYLAGFAESAKVGHPMPNIPEMASVWAPAASMIELVVMQQATPEQAAQQAVQAINEAVAAQR